ncbi:unnamed protein product [Prorocentrum cordatum]|uniref:Poly [ADP-ribose] polymerase n=1 Tax=Prorocentrum cordatum TaxID=2364126 RepID=A0ABN9VRN8_9DINO|nr:unnamed protein product [Polarella glacialis]
MGATDMDIERMLNYFSTPAQAVPADDDELEWTAEQGRNDFQVTQRQLRRSHKRRAAPPWSFPLGCASQVLVSVAARAPRGRSNTYTGDGIYYISTDTGRLSDSLPPSETHAYHGGYSLGGVDCRAES